MPANLKLVNSAFRAEKAVQLHGLALEQSHFPNASEIGITDLGI
jgi:hypothetical protein